MQPTARDVEHPLDIFHIDRPRGPLLLFGIRVYPTTTGEWYAYDSNRASRRYTLLDNVEQLIIAALSEAYQAGISNKFFLELSPLAAVTLYADDWLITYESIRAHFARNDVRLPFEQERHVMTLAQPSLQLYGTMMHPELRVYAPYDGQPDVQARSTHDLLPIKPRPR